MRRLAELGDGVALLPTHGSGSFCASSPPGDDRTSTVGRERGSNPALDETDESAFVARQLSDLSRYPSYYAHMAPLNRAGPAVFGDVPVPPPRSGDEVAAFLADGGWLVDSRPGGEFAAGHVPGSLNVPLESSFGSYVGWLVPFGTPLALLVPDGTALAEASRQLFRIGYEGVMGFVDGGLAGWRASGRAMSSYPVVEVERLAAEVGAGTAGDVVDVRQPSEWAAGHLDGSRHVFVGDVPDQLDEFDPATTTTVICASGYRSAMAASLLDRAGLPVRLVPQHGVPRALRLRRSA
jgi:hydroxyacylglutathione hydrolase